MTEFFRCYSFQVLVTVFVIGTLTVSLNMQIKEMPGYSTNCLLYNPHLPLTGSIAQPYDVYQYEAGTDHKHASGLFMSWVVEFSWLLSIYSYKYTNAFTCAFIFRSFVKKKIDGFGKDCMIFMFWLQCLSLEIFKDCDIWKLFDIAWFSNFVPWSGISF